jgi:hypothetical protein
MYRTVRYEQYLVGRRVLFFRRLQDSIDSSDSFLRYVRRYKEGKDRRRGLMTPRATKHYKQLEKGLCTSNRRVCSFKIVCTVCMSELLYVQLVPSVCTVMSAMDICRCTYRTAHQPPTARADEYVTVPYVRQLIFQIFDNKILCVHGRTDSRTTVSVRPATSWSALLYNSPLQRFY